MGWVQANLAGQAKVLGLVISRGYDIKFDSALRTNSLVQHIDMADLAADLR